MKLNKEYIYIIPLVLVLFTQELFIPYKRGEAPQQYVDFLITVAKIIPFLALCYSLYKVNVLGGYELYSFIAVLIYFVILVFESLYDYNSFIEYPHVVLKIMDLFVCFAFLALHRIHRIDLKPVMNLILLAVLVKVALNPDAINQAAFVETERAIPSDSAFLLLLPCLYFFNVYLTHLKPVALIKFLVLLFFIIFFQHRTVWTATFCALIFNVLILNRQKSISIRKTIPSVLVISVIGIFSVAILLTYLPSVADKIGEQVNNIVNPEEDATGSWRIAQYESYWPYVSEHFFEGMRFKGFELPIQFYNPETSGLDWEESQGHGHHFHSFYYDKLFYFGLIGLIIFLLIMFYPLLFVIKNNRRFNFQQIGLIVYAFSGVIFGIPYDFPLYFWAVLGISIGNIKQDPLLIQ